MNSISAFNAGLQGIQKGMNGIRKNAHDIANAKSIDPATQQTTVKDVTEPLVDLKLNQLQAEASTKVIQASADMIGSLLDIKA